MQIPRPLESSTDKAKAKDALPSSQDSGLGSDTVSESGTDVGSCNSDVHKADNPGSDGQESERDSSEP